MKDLTISSIERQNVLNNSYAIKKLQDRLDIESMFFDGEYWLTKKTWWQIFIILTHLR